MYIFRCLLGCMIGFDNIRDYEAADTTITRAGFTVVRPTGLSEEEGTGKYLVYISNPLNKP